MGAWSAFDNSFFFSQFHPEDDSALAVLTYAVENLGVEHSTYALSRSHCLVLISAFHSHSCYCCTFSNVSIPALDVLLTCSQGHTQCGGAAACHAAAQNLNSTAPATTPLARWLNPLTQLASSLASEKTDSHDTSAELATLVEANVCKQVENVVDTDVVQRAWASGKQGTLSEWRARGAVPDPSH